MRRVLVFATLVLLIIASLLSGTLAIYSKTIDLGSGSIMASSARSFVFLIAGTQNYQSAVNIAPTETAVFIFDIRNYDGAIVSEAAMHYDLTIDISAAPGKTAIGPLDVTIKNEENQILGTLTGTGTFQFSNDFFISPAGQKDTYIIELHWPSTDGDIEFEGDDYSTRIGLSATATQIVQPALPSAFTQAVGNGFAKRVDFLTKGVAWSYGSSANYDTSSWSGYLEKFWANGNGNDKRNHDLNKNDIKYSNSITGNKSIINTANWDAAKISYATYVPPAIIITNDPNLAPGSPYIANNVNSLKGSVVVYKANSSPVNETIVYYVGENGIPSPSRLLTDLLK